MPWKKFTNNFMKKERIPFADEIRERNILIGEMLVIFSWAQLRPLLVVRFL